MSHALVCSTVLVFSGNSPMVAITLFPCRRERLARAAHRRPPRRGDGVMTGGPAAWEVARDLQKRSSVQHWDSERGDSRGAHSVIVGFHQSRPASHPGGFLRAADAEQCSTCCPVLSGCWARPLPPFLHGGTVRQLVVQPLKPGQSPPP